MVRRYEEGDNSSQITELLLILLERENDPQNLVASLAFLKEDFRISLGNRRFRNAHFLLSRVRELADELTPERAWARPLIGRFFEEVAGPEILDTLAPVWAELPAMQAEELDQFSGILRLFPPQAGEALVPLLAQVESGIGRRILIDMISAFAAQDPVLLGKLLERPEEDLILRLVQIVREIPDRRQAELLLYQALKHPREKVRLEAGDILMTQGTGRYDKLFPLIFDPSPAVRRSAFAHLKRERNREVESLLLGYLDSDRFQSADPQQIADCYLTLGVCGSDASLPLLRRVLLGQPWNFMVGTGTKVHRLGAAVALNKLRTPAARQLLEEAANSNVPHIRSAALKATGE